MSELKPSNPKDAIGSSKLPVHLWPTTASAMGAIGLLDGMLKYGRSNWRASGVRASIYFDAANRHLNAWFEGEDRDPDSGVPHLAHALACLAIIVDAQAAGKLTDDRQHKGGYRSLLTELTGHVGRLKEMHADKAPKHFTIQDMPTDFGQQNTLDYRDPRTVAGVDVSFETERHMNFAPDQEESEHDFSLAGHRFGEGDAPEWFVQCSKCGVEVANA